MDEDTCAGSKAAVARIDHLARDIAPRDVRQRQLDVLEPAALPEVQVIQRARAHAHQRLPRVGRGIGHLEEFEDLGATVVCDWYRAHPYPAATNAVSPSDRAPSMDSTRPLSPTTSVTSRSGWR